MDDLNSYLKTLDQDNGIRGRGTAPAAAAKGSRGTNRPQPGQRSQVDAGMSGAGGIRGPGKGGKASAPPPAPSPPVDPSIPLQYQHLPGKAVKTALHVIDRIVAQAVRSGEVGSP